MKRFTSAEGLTLPEVAEEAARQLGLAVDSFLAAARDTALIRSVGLDGKDLEGYLLPETYTIPVTTTARELVTMQAARRSLSAEDFGQVFERFRKLDRQTAKNIVKFFARRLELRKRVRETGAPPGGGAKASGKKRSAERAPGAGARERVAQPV